MSVVCGCSSAPPAPPSLPAMERRPGAPLKALGEGRVGGYLVRFGSPGHRDLVGDYFTPETYFGPNDGDGVVTLVHHGFPLGPGLEGLADRMLAPLRTRRDEVGLWAETVLDLADAYERAVYELAAAGKLAWSSGAADHLVQRDADGRVRRWVIAEGSLTPTPAQPGGTRVAPLGAQKSTGYQTMHMQEDEPMGREHLEQMDDTVVSPGAATVLGMGRAVQEGGAYSMKALEERISEQGAALSRLTALLERVEQEPVLRRGGFVVGDSREAAGEDGEARSLKSFDLYVRRGVKAALQEGTAEEGGYLVPRRYGQEMVTALRDVSVLRQAGARVITVSGTNSLRVPTMTQSEAAVLTAEEGAYDEKEPTFGEVVLTPFKYTKLSKVSEELLADSRMDVVRQVLLPDAVQAFAAAENVAFSVGTGSGQPQGIVAGGTVGVTTASPTAITADEVISLYYALSHLYRPRAVWLMNDATIEAVRTLKDTTDQYLWQPGMQTGEPDRLFGRPVFPLNAMDTIAASKKVMVFGDISFFWVVDFGGFGMQRLDELYAASGQVGFRWFRRTDSRVMLSEAIQVMQMHA